MGSWRELSFPAVVWWLVLAAVVVALAVLVFAVAAVLGRLPKLRRAVGRLRRQQARALDLRESAEHVAERALELRVHAAAIPRLDQARAVSKPNPTRRMGSTH